jgi:hypothetical protein
MAILVISLGLTSPATVKTAVFGRLEQFDERSTARTLGTATTAFEMLSRARTLGQEQTSRRTTPVTATGSTLDIASRLKC